MPSTRNSHTSPFWVSEYFDIVFPGMKEYRPIHRNRGYLARWKGKIPETSFPVTMNGMTQVGLPLYKEVLKAIGKEDPSELKWIIGYNSLDDVRLFFCSPAQNLKVAAGMIPPYPPGLTKQMEYSALGTGIFPMDDGPDGPIRGIRFYMNKLYVYPMLCKTGIRKRKKYSQYSIQVPSALTVLEPGRITRHAKGDINKIYRARKADFSFHPPFWEIPFTLIYDTNGNLIYFKHYFYGGTEHIPNIDGCSFEIVDDNGIRS